MGSHITRKNQNFGETILDSTRKKTARYPKQPVWYGWFGETTISQIKIWNHPLETTMTNDGCLGCQPHTHNFKQWSFPPRTLETTLSLEILVVEFTRPTQLIFGHPRSRLHRQYCASPRHQCLHTKFISCTLYKFNMEPEHDGFQKESPIPGCHRSGSMLNFGRV